VQFAKKKRLMKLPTINQDARSDSKRCFTGKTLERIEIASGISFLFVSERTAKSEKSLNVQRKRKIQE